MYMYVFGCYHLLRFTEEPFCLWNTDLLNIIKSGKIAFVSRYRANLIKAILM